MMEEANRRYSAVAGKYEQLSGFWRTNRNFMRIGIMGPSVAQS
jgi:hypothetical protein